MPDDDEPQIFFALTPEGFVEEVEIFLDDRLMGQLSQRDPAAWEGLLKFIKDDLEMRDAP